MPRDKSNATFHLIKSLSKNEKRYFKIYVQRGGQENTKTIKLFDAILEQEVYNENEILKKHPDFTPGQFSNLKAELYKHILQALRLFHDGKNLDIKIRKHIDYSQLLIDRNMYAQAENQLKKAKKLASQNDSLELLLEIGRLEKKILTNIFVTNNQKKVNNIVSEIIHITEKINRVSQLSNLESKLNSLYKKVGFIRDKRDHNAIENYLNKNLPEYEEETLSILEKIHLYNLFIGYYFFIHDFLSGYKEAKKLVNLFHENENLKKSKTDFYIQALNKFSIAQSKLSRYEEFVKTVNLIQDIPYISGIVLNEDIKTKLYKYYYLHELNRYMMLGDFKAGVQMIEDMQDDLYHFIEKLDQHTTIIFYYKIASMHFGNSEYNKAIKWLNKIISMPDADIRRDIHCFARILNLVAHYELENLDVIDYYIRSTYRFLAKKHDLRLYQQYTLRFLKNLGKNYSNENITHQFINLREQLLTLRDKPYEKRAFIYFDIISWLESRISNRSVGEIIKEKALNRINNKLEIDS